MATATTSPDSAESLLAGLVCAFTLASVALTLVAGGVDVVAGAVLAVAATFGVAFAVHVRGRAVVLLTAREI